MKRLALLIEASEVPGETKLDGAAADVVSYAEWLGMRSGGQWYDSEIVALNTPRVSEVKKALTAIGKVDYAFVAFSGHGYHSKELNETKVCLRDGNMLARDL